MRAKAVPVAPRVSPHGRGALLADEFLDFEEDLLLGAWAEQHAGQGHHDYEAWGQRENRVVGQGRAQALGPVFVPVEQGGAQ